VGLKHYQQLVAWHKAIDFAEKVHLATRRIPREEAFGLTSQLRRACVSVPSNIAEGQGRGTTKDFLHFLRVSNGSLQEAETQIILAGRFDYLTDEAVKELLDLSGDVGRLNNGLIRS
jgi:four helix bundle protein